MAKLKSSNEEGYVTMAILPSTRKKLRELQLLIFQQTGAHLPMWAVIDSLADGKLAKEGDEA